MYIIEGKPWHRLGLVGHVFKSRNILFAYARLRLHTTTLLHTLT